MNPFGRLLRSSGPQMPLGTWILSASPLVAEAAGCAGFDWGVIDMEHSPLDVAGVTALLQAVGNTRMVPVVRVPVNEPVVVKRVLDAGATTVMFPMVQDAAQAAAAVAATRYPPEGCRGVVGMSRATRFGTDADALAQANRTVGVIVQVETAAALASIEGIAAVPGVDAVFVGPADLAADMGHGGSAALHPKVLEAMTAAAERCAALGRPVGTVGNTPREVAQLRAAGFGFVALGSDLGLFVRGARTELAALRGQPAGDEVHTLQGGTVTTP
ncbi:MAG: aldolase/citrate lyase family protein [Rubrivivax sp.]|jgi:2-keto-3-deoxy-L-rhamnonate aldolase RhmA|nr:aldolase/citrate lyase family protein [Rubrivivax sp.]